MSMSDPNAPILLSLFLAHLIGDFVLQTDRDVERKDEWRIRAKHSVAHATLAYILLGIWQAWWFLPLAVGVTHFGIDWLKLKLEKKVNDILLFLSDQIAHVLVLVGLMLFIVNFETRQLYWLNLVGPDIMNVFVLANGFLITVVVGGVTAGKFVKPFVHQIDDIASLEKGGKYIGQLERAIIFFFVMVGRPEAVGFLVAAKSIFRIGEKEKRKEAEYFLIGTLFSYGWGLVFAWGTKSLVDLS